MIEEESPQELAIKVLKAINKSVKSAVQMTRVPRELCIGSSVDLGKWSLVMTDDNLYMMCNQPDVHYKVDSTKSFVAQMFHKFWQPSLLEDKLQSLNISKSADISDHALTCVLRANTGLTSLNISGCHSITDVSLRELGMNNLKLQSLNISNCDGIEGQGLIAVAECCHHLRQFNCGNNRTLQKFAVSKIFYNCKKLEEVYISDYRECGDAEVRILAQNSPNLTIFKAHNTKFISDQGLLSLSQYCPDLEYVDVSREEHAYRITDVGLLALGERSKGLRFLNMNGCDQISDVGIKWLTKVCHNIEELHINGAIKVGDAGLRALGETCRALRVLDITGAQYATDVGLSNLGAGCPQLKTLLIGGMWLLSDPRLTAPMKGQKVEAWQTVVGIPSLIRDVPELEEIDVTGCFRLNTCVRSYLSTLANLRKINLSGCRQCESTSFQRLFKGCRKLQDVTLNDCVEGVDSDIFKAMAEFCKDMRVIIVHRCPKVTGTGIAYIAKCEHLEKLDVTGCASLTDVCILPVTEVDKLPALTYFSVVKCKELTDTALAWVANGCSEKLMTFSFKGTGITKPSCRAVRDMFAYCDMIFDDQFNGFFPKQRVGDRKLINHYYVLEQGFTKLQARVRRWRGTRRWWAEHKFQKEMKASLLISMTIRIAGSKNILRAKRTAWAKLNHQAELITSLFWMIIGKNIVKRIKEALYEGWVRSQAECLQRTWRLYWKKSRWYYLKKEFLEWVRLNVNSAIIIQALLRMRLGKLKAHRVFQMKKARAMLEERKSRYLQRIYRGYRGRLRAFSIRAELEHIAWERDRASGRIAHKMRIYHTNCIVYRRTMARRLDQFSATQIQKIIRAYQARFKVAYIRLDAMEVRHEWASLKIQTRWRIKKSRLFVNRVRKKHYALIEKQKLAVVVIQQAIRNRKARIKLAAKKAAQKDDVLKRVQARIWGATTIQAGWRARVGRIKYTELVRERKGKWKELYDEEKEKRFFYNKLTGEIRYRMPQDLLDLIPRPQCDNCEFYEANVECVVCNEVYCMQCFEQVHFGGRRRDHEFRCLYDFYGKRIDYGDGDFPSKWPTEVVQDEIQGWMLRVAPIRDPIATHGPWECYSDADVTGLPQPSSNEEGILPPERVFYFNRKTFEATYDTPDEISNTTGQIQQGYDQTVYQLPGAVDTSSPSQAYGMTHDNTYGRVATPGIGDMSGYYDQTGQYIAYESSQQPQSYEPSSDGYYDEHGQWIDSSGTYNHNNHEEEEEEYQGYYDEHGNWIDGDTYPGYYDDEGNYRYFDENVMGYWAANGDWVETAEDQQPVQHSSRGRGPSSSRGPPSARPDLNNPQNAEMIASARKSARSAGLTGLTARGQASSRSNTVPKPPAFTAVMNSTGPRSSRAPPAPQSGIPEKNRGRSTAR